MTSIPVITIDGPSGSGKGTIGKLLARELDWHFLDSGVLYRVLAYAAVVKNINPEDEKTLAEYVAKLPVSFQVRDANFETIILFEDVDITQQIRSEQISSLASKVAALPRVREALLVRQRIFRQPPGLVTDGRDMGSVVFQDADLKLFLTASIKERSRRRYQQLKEQGINVSLDALCDELALRDKRDEERKVAPLKPASDAIILDTTDLSIEEVLRQIMEKVRCLQLKGVT